MVADRRRRGMKERLGRLRFVSLRKFDRVSACCVGSAHRMGLSESLCAGVDCCTSLHRNRLVRRPRDDTSVTSGGPNARKVREKCIGSCGREAQRRAGQHRKVLERYVLLLYDISLVDYSTSKYPI